ncbi:MAG: hypothetical protein U0Q16_09635 [Bryobacteraceae bacterium]
MSRLLFLLTCSSALLPGQRFLYDAARDKAAQDTLDAAKRLTSTTVATTQMRNLAQIEKDLLQNEVAWTETSLKRNLNAFRTWASAQIVVNTVKCLVQLDSTADSRAELIRRQGEIAGEIQRLREAVASEKAPQEPPLITQTLLDRVNQAEDIFDFAKGAVESLPAGAAAGEIKAVGQALDELRKGVEQINALAGVVRRIATTAAAVRVDPKSLAPSPEAIEMQLLAAEVDYIKAVSVLRARRSLDKAEVLKLIREHTRLVKGLGLPVAESTDPIQADCQILEVNSPVRIEDTLRERASPGTPEAKEKVEEALQALVLGAAIAAWQDSSERIWSTREAIETRRWQIRRAGIYNGSYEATLVAASQRLAAYYSAGVKPSQLAQAIFQLGNAFAIPYLVVTK